MKKVMRNAFRAGVKGIRVRTSGRLGGAEMARAEGYSERKVPFYTPAVPTLITIPAEAKNYLWNYWRKSLGIQRRDFLNN